MAGKRGEKAVMRGIRQFDLAWSSFLLLVVSLIHIDHVQLYSAFSQAFLKREAMLPFSLPVVHASSPLSA